MNKIEQSHLEIDKDLALLYGIMLGDGCLSRYQGSRAVAITCNLYDDKPFFDEVVAPLLYRVLNKEVKYRVVKQCNVIEFKFSNKLLFHKLNSLGFPVGKKGSNLVIPKVFYKKDLMKYVIQGFFATDGSLVLTKNPNKFYPRLESETIHRLLISQIHKSLEALGMRGHVYSSKSKPNPRWKTTQKKYKFQFNGKKNLLLFNNMIDFINPKQKNKYSNFLKYSKEYENRMKGIPTIKQREVRKEKGFIAIQEILNASGEI